jgi:hypothetical protein
MRAGRVPRKPREVAREKTSLNEPELLKIIDPTKMTE